MKMSVNVYPVIQIQDICKDYKVRIRGQEVELNTARVSACPFNRRWPGHQRQIEQTELINFLSMETDEALEIEVLPKSPFEEVKIRPLEFGVEHMITEEGWIRFQIPGPGFYTVEPFGRHRALHLFVDPIRKYDIDIHDKNVIYFGKGIHEAGMIRLESNQTLFIDEGAVVFANVCAEHAENIRILGRGILDNSHNKETILFEVNAEDNNEDVGNAERIFTVQLEYCNNIEIDGITIRDSLIYNIRPIACKNLYISNVKIIGCWRYNSDGIDMHNCENAFISDCFIRTFDDSICVKGFDYLLKEEDMYKNGESYDVFRNVRVKNCTIWNDWGKCLEIGAETRAVDISDIVFRDCHVIHATGSVLDVLNVDYAVIHDVLYENIDVEYDDVMEEPLIQKRDNEIYVNRNPEYTPNLLDCWITYIHEYSAVGKGRGITRDISFKNIRLTGKHGVNVRFEGYDEQHLCSNITVENIYWNGTKVEVLPKDCFTINQYCENIQWK